jgi:hypothetical protein
MIATAFCPRCKTIVETNDEYVVRGGESFHECRGKLQWVKVKWKIEEDSPEEPVD